MTTTVDRFVDLASAPGGDGTTSATSGANRAYASADDAIVAELTARQDLVTRDELLRIHLNGATADADNNGSFATLNFANYASQFITDATRFVHFIVDPANQHPGRFSTAHYRISRGGLSAVVSDPPNFTKFTGLQFVQDSDNYLVGHESPPVGYTLIFERCIFHCTTTGTPTQTYGVVMQGNVNRKNLTVIECVFSGGGFVDPIRLRFPDNGKLIAYGNVAVGFTGSGINLNSGDSTYTTHLKNNIFERSGSGVCYDLSTVTLTSASNISNDATSPQTGLRNITLTFTNRGAFTFSLAAGDTSAIDAGTNLSADAQYPVTTDITNTTWTGTWEIGAFMFVAGGGGGGTTAIITNLPGLSGGFGN